MTSSKEPWADPGDYERRFMAAFEQALAEKPPWRDPGSGGWVTVEEVRMEGTYPLTEAVGGLRDDKRPQCRFGASERIWTESGHPYDFDASPEEMGSVTARVFWEWVTVGLPKECEPGAITWVMVGQERAIDPEAWEQRLKAWIERHYLRRPTGWHDNKSRGEVTVEDVGLDGSYPDTAVVVIVRDQSRPHCRFGFRIPLWAEGTPNPHWHTPEELAWRTMLGLEEMIQPIGWGLPDECDPQGITWAYDGRETR